MKRLIGIALIIFGILLIGAYFASAPQVVPITHPIAGE